MSDSPLWQDIEMEIANATGSSFQLENIRPIGGGCINTAYQVEGVSSERYFVKLNGAALLDMFEGESEALAQIAVTSTVKVPSPLCYGVAADQAFLVLEYVELGSATGQAQSLLGQQLAAMHGHKEKHYGWHRDNYIGSTPQLNTPPMGDWADFWSRQRLHFQLELAGRNGYSGNLQKMGENLCSDLSAFFATYLPEASLLHGDLWGGNFSSDQKGSPVLYDPASYYGDRETDLAMTELFGGFGRDFYAAYNSVWPLDPGYAQRKLLYNLYHILNHLNLFGGGYQNQAEQMIRQLNAELR